MRFRHIFLGIGSVLVILVLLLSDPDNGMVQNLPFGAGTLSTLIILVTSILYIGVLHLGRKGLTDYVDMLKVFQKAMQTPEGAGLVFVGMGLIMVSIAIVILAAVN